MRRGVHVALAVLLITLLLVSAAAASEVTVLLGNLDVIVRSASGVLPLEEAVAVCDQVDLRVVPPAGATQAIVYLNDQPALLSAGDRIELALDTTTLQDGEHRVRVEADLDGQQLASVGEVALLVANAAGALQEQVRATATAPPAFVKLQRKIIPRERVWFNAREGDLEKSALWRHGRLYVTATDLFRHLGGTMTWGPRADNWISIRRAGVELKIRAGTSAAYLNGESRSLGSPAIRIQDRTWVPVVGVCSLLGIATHYDPVEGRLYVDF